MKEVRASLDLGTNTFHLLIAEVHPNGFDTIHRERKYVFLGEQGIQEIGSQAVARATDAIKHFRLKLDEFGVHEVNTSATAAMRTAKNGMSLKLSWEAILGHPINIIDGMAEAQLIGTGVQLALGETHIPGMVVDIGGGSTEVILTHSGEAVWHRSHPFGLSTLKQQFHRSATMSSQEIQQMVEYINEQVFDDELKGMIKTLGITHLIGAAGSFEIFKSDKRYKDTECYLISTDLLKKRWEEVQSLKLEDLQQLDWLPAQRAGYIVQSLGIMKALWQYHPSFQEWLYSPYALKEGLLYQA